MKRPIHCALLGIPDDHAVLAVGGRTGASQGPKAFRQFFGKMTGVLPVHASVTDLGDVAGLPAKHGTDVHHLASQTIGEAFKKHDALIVVGGSHDHGFSHLAGMAAKAKKLGCINVDAHLDVRVGEPVVTSGSPFWLALERGVVDASRLVEFGIQDHCNAKGLWDYARHKKLKVVGWGELRRKPIAARWIKELKALAAKCDHVAISFDLDAIASAFAPGVSAPQAEGFSSRDAIEMCEIAGRHPKVTSLGIFELNPNFDQDGRTARLAATMAWHFLAAKLSPKGTRS